jgi:hypothetical protein
MKHLLAPELLTYDARKRPDMLPSTLEMKCNGVFSLPYMDRLQPQIPIIGNEIKAEC